VAIPPGRSARESERERKRAAVSEDVHPRIRIVARGTNESSFWASLFLLAFPPFRESC